MNYYITNVRIKNNGSNPTEFEPSRFFETQVSPT